MLKNIIYPCPQIDARIKKIISKYLNKGHMLILFQKGNVKTKHLVDKELQGKFKFSYNEIKKDSNFSFRLKISASKKSGLIRNDSVCTETLIDKQTLFFDSSLGFNDNIAKQLKKDIKAFFNSLKQQNTSHYEED
jgi:hypothetical protein